ncbi:MAG: hypothetical protein AAF828_06685 [Bacteroidota bacterium]
MNGIHISEVLATMEQLADEKGIRHFSISFVRNRNGKGGKRGSIKHVKRAIKGTKKSMASIKSKSGGLPKAKRMKSFSGIPIRDLDSDQFLTPKFTHIVGFNGQKVIHYGR